MIEIGSIVTATITGKVSEVVNGGFFIHGHRNMFPADCVTLESESLETQIRGLIAIMRAHKPYRTMTVTEIAETLEGFLK